MNKKTLLILNFSHPISDKNKKVILRMYKDHLDPEDEIKKVSVIDIYFHISFPETLEFEISRIIDDNNIQDYLKNYKHVVINLPGLAAAAVQVVFQLKIYKHEICYLVWTRDSNIPPKFIPIHIATV